MAVRILAQGTRYSVIIQDCLERKVDVAPWRLPWMHFAGLGMLPRHDVQLSARPCVATRPSRHAMTQRMANLARAALAGASRALQQRSLARVGNRWTFGWYGNCRIQYTTRAHRATTLPAQGPPPSGRLARKEPLALQSVA